tara:strand:- start:366 stop:1064 length:699 start_codon:yes stop_codon:yes gene_type:complete
MKRKLTKTEFEALTPEFQSEYKEKDGNYLLDIDGGDDAITKALANAKADKTALRDKLTEAEEALAKISGEAKEKEEAAARKKGDFTSIEKSYQEKIAALEKAQSDFADKLHAESSTRLISEARDQIGDIFINPGIMAPHIEKRLSVETNDGKSIVRVLDTDGNPTGASVSELKKELLSFDGYKTMIKASGASGGGASGSSGSGGAKTDSSNKIDYLNDDPKKVAAALAPSED